MSWKVLAWILLLNGLVQARRLDDRTKRFMMTLRTLAPSRGQAGTGTYRKNNFYDNKDWNPEAEYPIPASSRMAVVRAPPLPVRSNGRYLKDLMTVRTWRHIERDANARADRLLLDGELIAREHAKLVNDINGLSESHSPWSRVRDQETTTEHRNEMKDESIYMENLEPRLPAAESVAPTLTQGVVASSARPPTVNLKIVPAAVAGSVKPALALPVIVLGGNTIKQQQKLTTMKHPYPFVGAASTARPARLRPVMPFAYPIRMATPTLWQRFLSIFPKII